MKNRNINIDLLKSISCIGVVIMHTINFEAGIVNTILYYTGTISVPIFFMIDGYFILNKEKISFKYILKKIERILRIVISWNIIYSTVISIYRRKI